MKQGDKIIYTYEHTNGNQRWWREKEGIFLAYLKDISSWSCRKWASTKDKQDICLIFLDENVSLTRVPVSSIKLNSSQKV